MFKIISYIILISGNIFLGYTNNFISNNIVKFFTNTDTQEYNLTSKSTANTIAFGNERKYQLLNSNIRKNEDNFIINFIDYNHTYNKVNFFGNNTIKTNKYNILSRPDKIRYDILFNYLVEEHNTMIDLYNDLDIIISNQYNIIDNSNKVIDMNLFNKYGTIVFRNINRYDIYKKVLIEDLRNINIIKIYHLKPKYYLV